MRKYGESKTTRIMMATVPHVISGSGLRKFQADRFLLDRVYMHFYGIYFMHWTYERNTIKLHVQTFLRMNTWMFETCRRLTYLLTYLLTPWSRVLLEQLIGSAASQEIPRIFGTRRFITVLTSARHLSLS